MGGHFSRLAVLDRVTFKQKKRKEKKRKKRKKRKNEVRRGTIRGMKKRKEFECVSQAIEAVGGYLLSTRGGDI